MAAAVPLVTSSHRDSLGSTTRAGALRCGACKMNSATVGLNTTATAGAAVATATAAPIHTLGDRPLHLYKSNYI